MTSEPWGQEQAPLTDAPLRQIPVEDAVAGLLSALKSMGQGTARRVGGALADAPGRATLETLLRHDSVRAASLWSLRRLAGQGVTSAQRALGYRLASGDGIAPDMVEAFQWLRQAARKGDAAAQYGLGVMYANGQGVAACTLQASIWYQKAAEQGHAAAQFNLALIFADGDGVQPDLDKAKYWYQRAADQDYPRALFNLAVILDDEKAEPEQVLALYTRAAELGFALAHLRLAELSLGRPPRIADACFWFTLAALGLPEGEERERASHGRDCCHASMPLAEIEAVRQRVRTWRGL